MRIGQMVMLVGTDGYMPPLGSTGQILGIDDDGEYLVTFAKYPCPNPPGEWWYALGNWLMPIPTLNCKEERSLYAEQ